MGFYVDQGYMYGKKSILFRSQEKYTSFPAPLRRLINIPGTVYDL